MATSTGPGAETQSVKVSIKKGGLSNNPVWSINAAEERELKGDDERTLLNPDIVRDAIIGFSDGITVPFGLTAGLASLGSTKVVILGGIAELIAGSFSMGIGGFLASQADRDHYLYLRRSTHDRVQRSCAGEMEREIHEILGPFGLEQSLSRRIAGALLSSEKDFVRNPPSSRDPSWIKQWMRRIARTPSLMQDGESLIGKQNRQSLSGEDENLTVGKEDVGMTAFLLKVGEGLEDIPTSRLWISALTIGLGYLIGGLIPLTPYFIFSSALIALYWSIGVTCVTLVIFGLFKTYFTGAEVGFWGYIRGSSTTLFVGSAAALIAWLVVKALDTQQ